MLGYIKKRVNSFDEMSDLARDFRDVLKSEFDMSELTLKR